MRHSRKKSARRVGWLRVPELALYTLGCALLVVFLAAQLRAATKQRSALRSFERLQQASATAVVEEQRSRAEGAAARRHRMALPEPDQAEWSPERVRRYERATVREDSAPLAILRIPAIDLTVAVLDGTDEPTLDVAVGRVRGTARPGEPGNIAIAGHRDGFFRGLGRLKRGQRIELTTLDGVAEYRITDMRVVDPADVSVLRPTEDPAITLVTCYPFYFVGPAPERFIVRGERVAAAP